MTDQERSAAREALAQFYSIPSTSSANYLFPESSIAIMHAVLKKHEADFRKRIADEVKSLLPAQGSADWAMLSPIVNLPEPPKPALCEHCGRTEDTHALVMLNGERILLCSDRCFKPAEST